MSDILHLTGTILSGADEDGNVLECGDAWVLGGRITYERPADAAGAPAVTGVFLPGLVDVHCHVGVIPAGAADDTISQKQAIADRNTGVTLIRDAGSARDTRFLEGRADLPEIVRAGRFIARPKRYIRNLARELGDVADLPAAAAEEARVGDGWIKLIADWIDRDLGADADLAPLWPTDVLAEAVAAAHAEGARVTAHTFATEAVDPLLDANVDCLEHGTGMTPVQIERAAAQGVPVVPTLLQIGQFESIAAQGEEKYPRFAVRMREMYVRRHQQARHLFDAGVRMFVGTDAGGTIGHGSIADEAAEWVQAGIPAPAVVAAASWEARTWLGRPSLEEGAPADLVGFAADPRQDIRALGEPTLVIVRGAMYRLP